MPPEQVRILARMEAGEPLVYTVRRLCDDSAQREFNHLLGKDPVPASAVRALQAGGYVCPLRKVPEKYYTYHHLALTKRGSEKLQEIRRGTDNELLGLLAYPEPFTT